MDSERWQRIETLFDAALDLDPSRWDTFLDERCRDDQVLRAEVAALLASHVAPAEAAPEPRRAGFASRLWGWRWAIATCVLAAVIAALALALRSQIALKQAVDAQRVEAETTARNAVANGYVHALAAAEAMIRDHESDDARRLLDQAAPELRGWEWRHLQRRLDRSLYTIAAAPKPVTCLAFAHDGTFVAAASRDGTISLWNTQNGDSLRRFGPLGAAVESIAIHPADTVLAAGLSNGTVIVLRVADGGERARLSGKGTARVAFNPDGSRLAAGFQDGTVQEWKTDAFKPSGTLDAGTGALCVAYSANGRYLVTGDGAGRVKVWDARNNRRVADLPAHQRRVTGIAAAGEVFATASEDHVVRVWRVSDRKPVCDFRGHDNAVTSLAFSPDGADVVSASSDGRVLRWRAENASAVSNLVADGAALALAVDPVTGRVAAGGTRGRVRVWPAGAEDVRTFASPDNDVVRSAVNQACLNHDGTLLAGAADRLSLDLWDAASGRHLATLETARADYPVCVAFSPNGSHLFTGDRGGNVIVFDPLSHRRLLAFAAHSAAVSGLAVSPDGNVLATAGNDSTLKFWDARNLSPRGEFRGVTGSVTRLAFAPDGTLAGACTDRVIRLWNTAGGDTVRVLRGHSGPVIDLAYSADGARLVSATRDGDVRIWNASTGAALDAMEIGRTDAVCFSPDGGRILAGGAGSSIRVIDPAGKREVLRLHGHTGRVLSLACSPDAVISASADGTVRMWDGR